MASGELVGPSGVNLIKDAGVLRQLVSVSQGLTSEPTAGASPKIDPWLKDFLERSNDEKRREYQYEPDLGLVGLAVKHTYETHLGGIYSQVRREARLSKGVNEVRVHVVGELKKIRENVGYLESHPEWIHEFPLVSASFDTLDEAYEVFGREVSGREIRWYDRKPEELEMQVKRAALLRALNFPLSGANKLGTQANFASRIETTPGAEFVMELWWGYGNPHVFYGIDFTGIPEPEHPVFTVKDKVVVALADSVAKNFIHLGSFPQNFARKT